MHRRSNPQLFPGNRYSGDVWLVLGHSWREGRCVAIAFSLWLSSEGIIIIVINRIITMYREATAHLPCPTLIKMCLGQVFWSEILSWAWSQVVWNKKEKLRGSEYLMKRFLTSSWFSLHVSHLPRFSEGVTHCLYWRNFIHTAETHSQMHPPLFICMWERYQISVWPVWVWRVFRMCVSFLPFFPFCFPVSELRA